MVHVGIPRKTCEMKIILENPKIVDGKYGLPLNTCSYPDCPMYDKVLPTKESETKMHSLLKLHLFENEDGKRTRNATHKTVYECKYNENIHDLEEILQRCNSMTYFVHDEKNKYYTDDSIVSIQEIKLIYDSI